MLGFYIDNFETVYGTKDNIQALRNKVLELAVQGKLVEQNGNGESASELVKRIKAERDKLVKEGKIKKQSTFKLIEKEETPFEIPENWEWVHVGDLSEVKGGKRTSAGYTLLNEKTEHVYIRVTDMKNGSVQMDSLKYIDEEQFEKIKNYTISKDDVYITIAGTIGAVGIIPEELDGMNLTENASKVVFYSKELVCQKFFYWLLTSPVAQKQFNDMVNQMAQPKLALTRIVTTIVPFPPLEEQHRIVDKIETLMYEIDKLEEKLQKKEHIMKLLPEAVVDSISKCQNGEELKEQLQFIIENFEVIFQTPESMQELRNVILQLAIEGKLVTQDKTDETASELVKRIMVEKDKLIKEGKIKKEKPLSKIEEDVIPFEIPESWEWIKAGDLCYVINYGYTASAIQNNTGTKLLRITDIQNGKVDWSTVPFCKIEDEKVGQYKLNENDIVIARTGGTVGKSFIIKNVNTQAVYASYLIRMIPNENINPDYYYLMLNSPLYWTQISEGARGGAQPNVNAQMLSNLIISLPPLAEQQRIVQKVESIMKLIDQMENQLKRKNKLVEKMASI